MSQNVESCSLLSTIIASVSIVWDENLRPPNSVSATEEKVQPRGSLMCSSTIAEHLSQLYSCKQYVVAAVGGFVSKTLIPSFLFQHMQRNLQESPSTFSFLQLCTTFLSKLRIISLRLTAEALLINSPEKAVHPSSVLGRDGLPHRSSKNDFLTF